MGHAGAFALNEIHLQKTGLSMRLVRNVILTLFSLATCTANLFGEDPGDLIDSGSLMHTVEILSSEPMAGRLPGHTGYAKAAHYMASEFEKIGLLPVGDEGYFQNLKVEYNEILSPCSFEIHLSDDEIILPELGRDFTFRGFTGSGDIFTEVVFAGYGISMPEAGYDDFAGLDVTGKMVMVFRSNPSWKIDGFEWPGASPREKSHEAFKHGAAGIMFVAVPGDRTNMPEVIGSVMHGPGKQLPDFPQLVISSQLANQMLLSSSQTLETIFDTINQKRQPASLSLSAKVKVQVRTDYFKEVPTVNILGMIAGNDPSLKDEYLIIGAHLDHVGQQCEQVYFPGANDNASGSAAVLEIARAFSRSELTPARSIIFVLFASEEQGLLGAEHFVANCPVPVEKIVAMLNFDCIAHGDSIQLGNGNSSPELWNLAKQLDSDQLMVERTWHGGGADLTPFHNAGIPGLYFVSTNSYSHLHSVSDRPETLNQELFTAITRLGFRTALNIAGGGYSREIVQ